MKKVYEIYKVSSGTKTRVLVVSSKAKAIFFIEAKFIEGHKEYAAFRGDTWNHDKKKTLTKNELLNWNYQVDVLHYYYVKTVEVL